MKRIALLLTALLLLCLGLVACKETDVCHACAETFTEGQKVGSNYYCSDCIYNMKVDSADLDKEYNKNH